ncbi:MAG TPA: hypothetical protein VFT74_07850 [Isosphaeraceae bacterium]|nr:hypothetical protein [Isosphaeraceae bacterium]
MPAPLFLDVDPRTLHLPTSSRFGADPVKLQRQIARYGTSTAGMPNPWVYRGSDGGLVISNGVTRATRVAKLLPGTLIRVEVIGAFKTPVGHYPTVGDRLP